MPEAALVSKERMWKCTDVRSQICLIYLITQTRSQEEPAVYRAAVHSLSPSISACHTLDKKNVNTCQFHM